MKASFAIAASALGLSLLAFGTAAGQNRAELINRARVQPNDSLALELLMQAANPEEVPPDSLWAAAIHDLAMTLIGLGNQNRASIWLRWSARHGSAWPADRSLPSVLVSAFDNAAAAVQTGGGMGDPAIGTSWRWPGTFNDAAPGVLAVTAADPAAAMTVSVPGQGTMAPGDSLLLAPGSYEIVASASGYETARATREVLPGVTTILDVYLAPVLPDDALNRAAATLVSIRHMSGGREVCTTGFIGRPDGLVLTSTSALGSRTGLEVRTASGVFSDVTVAATDPDLDLAVLQLSLTGQPTLSLPSNIQDGQHVWSTFNTGCTGTNSAHARLGDWPGSPSGVVRMATSLPLEAVGGPLFNLAGQLDGVVVGPDQVAPATLAQRLLNRAFADQQTGTQPQMSAGGGGPPWMWIGAGVAAAGVAALLLGGGGGDGGGETPTTGSITVTFPGGI